MTAPKYPKVFPPLESDPALFTTLLHNLGARSALHFEDVFSLDDASSDTTLAYILIAPSSEDYEKELEAEEERRIANLLEEERRRAESVVWLPQRIHNACGFYALLHCVLNIPDASSLLSADSFLARILSAPSLEAKRQIVENDPALDEAYIPIALQGQTPVNEDWAWEPMNHYLAFATVERRVWELNGGRKGAVDRGEGELEEVIKKRIEGKGEACCLLRLVG
ncbi:MAG: hypothetical protein MMC33_010261 [Icmadophila ericetorum]|nr:hypothetical protein [Icmadophila ericetorum]